MPDSWSRYRSAVAEGIRLSDHIVAPSFAMLAALHNFYGSLPPSSVVCNGTSPDRFSPAEKRSIIFAAGRLWDEAKNIDAVIRCARKLPWQFVIAGDGEPGLVPSENVLLIGSVSPQIVARHMAIASIYCLPARYEPFGLSILEAAFSGCALVLGDIDSLRELWNGAAVFVPPDDYLSLEETLGELIEDERKRRTLARLAQQRASRFTVERMAASYLKIYKRLLKTRRVAVSEDMCA